MANQQENLNRSFVNGDITNISDDDTTVATGHGVAFGAGAHGNAAAGDGGIASLGNVTQADHGGVAADGSFIGGPVATNPVNSIVAGGGVDHSVAGQGNVGINADHSVGGLANAGLNFGAGGSAQGGGNVDASHHTNTAVSHSTGVNLATEGSVAEADQSQTTEVFKDSFNDLTDDHSVHQDNSVEQFRSEHVDVSDSFDHFGD
jgi:hypothetical protein